MGGQITRYALTYMEKNPSNLTNNGIHNTRLWISFDSPHQGANMPLGAQAFLHYFGTVAEMEDAKKQYNELVLAPATEQMLKYHILYNGQSISNIGYQAAIDNLGFPSNLRKIAVTNGSLNNTQNGWAGREVLELFHTIKLGNWQMGEVSVAKMWLGAEYGNSRRIFQGKHNNGKGVLLSWSHYDRASESGSCCIDAASGGTFATFKMIREEADKMDLIREKYTQLSQEGHCFMPVKSTLAYTGSNKDNCHDISGICLVQRKETPFDSYTGPVNKNMEHVTYDAAIAKYVREEIETYIMGSRNIDFCSESTYSVHLPANVNANIKWLCSSNLKIVQGNSPTEAIVYASGTGKGWISAEVSSLTRSYRLANYPIDIQTPINSPLAQSEIIINTEINGNNETWNNIKVLSHTFTVGSGKTLSITSTSVIHCTSNAKIIVNPSGKLIIDGGVLTNACDNELWQGIEVWGNSDLEQYNECQGVVELKNGARIENAVCGIYVGEKNSYFRNLSGGGIVRASDAEFYNCKQAVRFVPYIFIHQNLSFQNPLKPNKSNFNNCTFLLDDEAKSLFTEAAIAQVELHGIYALPFFNCVFQDNRTKNSPQDFTNGIYANNSSARIGEYPILSFPRNGCEFAGFNKAIHIINSGMYFSQIYASNFYDNQIAISADAVNNLRVQSCQFYTSDMSYFDYGLYGIVLNRSYDYQIANNIFEGQGGIGIHFKNSGAGYKKVNNNDFHNICVGVTVEGNNSDGREDFGSSGLVFKCNSYQNNEIDIDIQENGNIRHIQSGDRGSATGNVFINSPLNINNNGYPIKYYYNGSGFDQMPYFEPSHTVNLVSSRGGCNHYGYAGDVYYTPSYPAMGNISIIEEEYLNLEAEHLWRTLEYEEKNFINRPIDWEDPAVIEFIEYLDYSDEKGFTPTYNCGLDSDMEEQIILYFQLTDLREQMDVLCHAALDLILSYENDYLEIESYRLWVSRLNTVESEILLIDSYLDAGEFEQAEIILDEMPLKFRQLDEGLYQDYRTYFTIVRDYVEAGSAYLESHFVCILEDFFLRNNLAAIKFFSWGAMMAGDWYMTIPTTLTKPNCSCITTAGHLKSASGNERITDKEKDVFIPNKLEISVYPNPANNILYIKLDKFPQTSVNYTLYDIQGKELSSGSFEGQKHELNISHISKGIYFIRCTTGNQPATTKKVIKE